MDSSVIVFSIVIVVGLTAGVLALLGFYRKSYLGSHKLQYISIGLSVAAVTIAIYDKIAQPDLPEVLAVCSEYEEFVPTKIKCFEKSKNAKDLLWVYEDGTKITGTSEIERTFDTPGQYQITLEGAGKGFAFRETARSIVDINVKNKPVEKKVLTTPHRFSESNSSGGNVRRSRTFTANDGFKILDARLSISSKKNADVRIISKNENQVTIEIDLKSHPRLKGLEFRLEKAYISGNVILTQEEI